MERAMPRLDLKLSDKRGRATKGGLTPTPLAVDLTSIPVTSGNAHTGLTRAYERHEAEDTTPNHRPR